MNYIYLIKNKPTLIDIFNEQYYNNLDNIMVYILTMSKYYYYTMSFCKYCYKYDYCYSSDKNIWNFHNNKNAFLNNKYYSCSHFKPVFNNIYYLNINLDNSEKIYNYFKLDNIKNILNDFKLYELFLNKIIESQCTYILFKDNEIKLKLFYDGKLYGNYNNYQYNLIDITNRYPEEIEWYLNNV